MNMINGWDTLRKHEDLKGDRYLAYPYIRYACQKVRIPENSGALSLKF